jgi:hypothetical protein
MSLEICDRVAEGICRRIESGFPDLRTSSEFDERTGLGDGIFLDVSDMSQGGRYRPFAEFAIRCRREGIGLYAVDVSCSIAIIESKKEGISFNRDKIEKTLREHQSLRAFASETMSYRGGLRQLGEDENEIVSRHYVEFSFPVARLEQRLGHQEAGSALDSIGEPALAALKAIMGIRKAQTGR